MTDSYRTAAECRGALEQLVATTEGTSQCAQNYLWGLEQRIAELEAEVAELEAEVARLKAANHHAHLLRRQAAINARLTELYLRGASLQDPERMRLESELGELVEEIERMEAPDGR